MLWPGACSCLRRTLSFHHIWWLQSSCDHPSPQVLISMRQILYPWPDIIPLEALQICTQALQSLYCCECKLVCEAGSLQSHGQNFTCFSNMQHLKKDHYKGQAGLLLETSFLAFPTPHTIQCLQAFHPSTVAVLEKEASLQDWQHAWGLDLNFHEWWRNFWQCF